MMTEALGKEGTCPSLPVCQGQDGDPNAEYRSPASPTWLLFTGSVGSWYSLLKEAAPLNPMLLFLWVNGQDQHRTGYLMQSE